MSKASKKPAPDNRLQLRYTEDWLKRINLWRRAQPDPIPNISEAIRTLVTSALDADMKKGSKK